MVGPVTHGLLVCVELGKWATMGTCAPARQMTCHVLERRSLPNKQRMHKNAWPAYAHESKACTTNRRIRRPCIHVHAHKHVNGRISASQTTYLIVATIGRQGRVLQGHKQVRQEGGVVLEAIDDLDAIEQHIPAP